MKSFCLLLCLFSFLSIQAQPDTTYFVQLKNGQRLYSAHLELQHSDTADKYLELDDHRQIPINEVARYQSHNGVFITVPGSAGTDVYRVEREGSKISLYSKLVIDPARRHNANYTPTRLFYFRKTGQETMQPDNPNGLRYALADNPASLHQLQLAKSQVHWGLGITLASAGVAAIGLVKTFRNNTAPPPAPPTIINGQPQPAAPSVPHHTLSPLVFIGGGGMLGGLILTFGSNHHEIRALDLYNQ